MSLAEILTGELRIVPAGDGSFIAHAFNKGSPVHSQMFGFTNVDDLLSFLQRAAKARPIGVLDLAEPLVTRTVTSQVKAWPVHEGTDRTNIGDPVTTDRVRRTTAAGDLADRVASTGDKPAA